METVVYTSARSVPPTGRRLPVTGSPGLGPHLAITLLCLLATAPVSSASSDEPQKEISAELSAETPDTPLDRTHARTTASPAAGTADPVTEYNRGVELYNQGQRNRAIQAWERSRLTEDLHLQALAAYNIGTARAERALKHLQAQETQAAQPDLEKALSMLRTALLARPDDVDCKINYELALRLREKLRRLQQRKLPAKKSNPPPHEDRGKQQTSRTSSPQSEKTPAAPKKIPRPGTSGTASARRPPTGMTPPRSGTPATSIQRQSLSREQVENLLNALRDEEAARRGQVRLIRPQPVPVEKDW